jgi:hypothetical protein
MLQDVIIDLNEAERIHKQHGHELDEYGRMLVLQSAGSVCVHCLSPWGHYRICPLIGGEGLRDTRTTLIDLGIDFRDELALERRREPRFDPQQHRQEHKQEREVTA